MTVPELDVSAIVERLERLAQPEAPHGIAFDADGTLWTADVGETVFEYAIERNLLREEALTELRSEAHSYGARADQNQNETARTLYSLYRAGDYPERRACEMMVWCYAGMTEAEVDELTSEALQVARFFDTINEHILPLVEWAQEQDFHAVVISASPALMVNRAASQLGFSARDVLGGRARLEGESIVATMQETLPYGPGKAEAGRRAFGGAVWLASCGDSAFDLDMMRVAGLAVGVRPKPELRRALASLPAAVVLKERP